MKSLWMIWWYRTYWQGIRMEMSLVTLMVRLEKSMFKENYSDSGIHKDTWV